MADVEAKLLISVVDNATKALKSIQGGLTGIDKTVQENQKNIRNFGLAFTAAGGAITLALGLAVNAGREQIAVQKQLNAVLTSTKGAAGLTADQINRMASALQNVTNFDDEAILGGQNLLLTFTRIGSEVFPQATEAMLNISTAMKTDVKSAAIQLGKALNDPLNGLDALTRIGVTFSEQQKKVIQDLVATGQVAEAQKVILQELETEFGGVARALADPMTQLKNSIGDVSDEIGVALIPIINDLVKTVLPLIQNLTEWIKQNPELTKTVVIITAALAAMLTIVGGLSLGLLAVSSALAVVGLTLAVGGALFVAIGGIISLVVVLTQHWDALKVYAGMAVDFMVEKFNGFLGIVKQAADAISGLIERFNVFEQAKSAVQLLNFQPTDYSIPQVQARAKGGPSGGLTLVGEEGPELVNLPRGSYVNTAKETQGMMGGVSIGEVNVYNEADEDRLIQKLTRMIQLQSLAA